MNQQAYNNLEDRFVYLSENQEFDYQKTEWTKLESRLDQDESRNKYFLVLLFLGVVSIAALGFVMLGSSTSSTSNDNPIDSEQVVQNTLGAVVTPDLTSDQAARSFTIKDGLRELAPNSGESLTTSNNVKKDRVSTGQLTTPTTTKAKVLSEYKANSLSNTSDGSSNSKNAMPIDVRDDSINSDKEQGEAPVVTIETPTIGSGGEISNRTEVSSPANAQKELFMPSEAESGIYSLAKLPVNILPLDVNEESYVLDRIHLDNSLVEKIQRPKFYVNLSAGVELASTPLGELSDTDFNFGLKLGYVASSKLVLTAGVNYINECYMADGDDYTAPTGFWSATEGVAPESILAVCDMIDFSIGASYHFTDVQSRGLAAHINLGSNFMVREEYNYMFSESADNWTGVFDGESSSILSNVELSTTYKLDLGRDFIIDAGPYLKIPASGIGHGNVRLSSFGFRVGVSIIK